MNSLDEKAIILSMSDIIRQKRNGFTIVELLIVIVVIAILASISIVAYNGVQQRANEARLSSDINGIKKGMELYKLDKGKYPSCNSGGDCWFGDVMAQLTPDYVSDIGTNEFGYAYYSGMPDTWGAEYKAEDPPYNLPTTCKFGVNMPDEWFTSAPLCK